MSKSYTTSCAGKYRQVKLLCGDLEGHFKLLGETLARDRLAGGDGFKGGLRFLVKEEGAFKMAFLQLLNSDHFNLFTFGATIHDEQTAIQAAYDLGLIPEYVDCPVCDFRMSREVVPQYKLGFRWICHRRACNRPRISPLRGTFFENVHISFLQTFRLIICWFFRVPVTQAATHAEVHVSTAVDFYSFLREICRVVHSHDEEQIGGDADVVEVDESHLFTPKYHRGRRLRRALWVFGGISRLTRRRFVVQIGNKKRNTLFPLMQQHIAQGSFIMSDEARMYRTCEVLGFSGHCAVNHSRRYVRRLPAFVPSGHPRLGRVIPTLNLTVVRVFTNTLERAWRDLKSFLRQCRSVEMIPNYIGEYLYRRNILDQVPATRRNMGTRMFRYFDDIKRVYPGPGNTPISTDDCECDDCT